MVRCFSPSCAKDATKRHMFSSETGKGVSMPNLWQNPA